MTCFNASWSGYRARHRRTSVSLVLFAVEGVAYPRAAAFPAIAKQRSVIGCGLLVYPLVGLLGSKISHGPFIERYFTSSVAGYAIFLGFAASRIERSSR